MKRIFFFSLLAAFLVEIPIALGGDSLYYEQRDRLAKTSIQVLIRRGLCVDENDCHIKQFVLVAGSTGGVVLNVYGISDLPAISEIFSASIDEYEKNGGKMGVFVEVYRQKHEDVMGFIRPIFTSPYIKLYFKGEK